MTEPTTTPIAEIGLARSLPRLLVTPIVVALAGAASIAAGVVAAAGAAQIALIALGALVVVGAAIGAWMLLRVRLGVEESAVRLSWPGGERRYVLTPGPVTRVRLRGTSSSRLRPRLGALGWGIGRARLREEEPIELVRLAPTATAILVPTERGRLAIAPARDEELLEALSEAARARQRLEEITTVEAGATEAPDLPAATAAEPALPEPVALTGIERALLEERLGRERAEEVARLEAERLASDSAPAAVERPEPVELIVASAPEPVGRRSQRLPIRRPRPAVGLALLPTIAAGVAWGLGLAGGSLPAAGSDMARLTSLALVLAGPATSVGAVMALAWWPRLVGIVVAGGIGAAVFIGRALIG
jgi:hypothetical protein